MDNLYGSSLGEFHGDTRCADTLRGEPRNRLRLRFGQYRRISRQWNTIELIASIQNKDAMAKVHDYGMPELNFKSCCADCQSAALPWRWAAPSGVLLPPAS